LQVGRVDGQEGEIDISGSVAAFTSMTNMHCRGCVDERIGFAPITVSPAAVAIVSFHVSPP
jgi:hypothetical protein